MQQALQMGFDPPHLIVVHGDLTDEPGALHLGLQYLCLQALSYLLMCCRILNQLVQNLSVLHENAPASFADKQVANNPS